MAYRILADAVLVIHLSFIVFVVAGGFLVRRWRGIAWLHLPAVAWGALIEFMGWVCPLTPLEIWARSRAGGTGYSGGFIEHYLLPVVYPAALTHETQIVLGALVLILNVLVYAWIIDRALRGGAGSRAGRSGSRWRRGRRRALRL
jgi:hypothetical protein